MRLSARLLGWGQMRFESGVIRFVSDREVEEESIGNSGAVEGEGGSQPLMVRRALAIGQQETSEAYHPARTRHDATVRAKGQIMTPRARAPGVPPNLTLMPVKMS